MGIFSRAERTVNTTSGNAALEVLPGLPSGFRLMEFGYIQVTANAGVIGLGQAAANSATPTGGGAVFTDDYGDTLAGLSTTSLAWGTGPVAPTFFFRRASLPATIGAGFVWTFPRGYNWQKGVTNNTLVCWNLATNATVDLWIVLDE